MTRLVVVSNRVSVPKDERTQKGGLAVALDAATKSYDCVWFGWDGKTVASVPRGMNRVEIAGTEYCTLPLSKQDYDNYYGGYANRVLWPLFHQQVNLVQFETRYWSAYQGVNRFLAHKLSTLLRNGDLVWVHDYHLMLIAQNLRELGCNLPMGFFIHIPFPCYDMFRIAPGHEELLQGLCCFDLLGFQTELDRDAFVDCVRHVLPDSRVRGSLLDYAGRKIRLGVFPIGIDVDHVREQARRGQSSAAGKRLADSLNGRKLVIGIDRIDYSKGLVSRIRAYERMLNRYPSHRESVVLLQVAQPSRNDVPEYRAIQRSLASVVGQVNSQFSEFDWLPIRYVAKGMVRSTVLGFLGIGAVGLVTPLRDGMNLVAKEYVAAQDPDDPGVLVLSQFTGAARELHAAVQVNPYDTDNMADALARAISMPLEERKERWNDLIAMVRHNDVHRWCRTFLQQLDHSRQSKAAVVKHAG